MKTVGIIGGLGPETTAEFYLELSFGCQKKSKTTRPKILIWNVPGDYKTEEEVITKNVGTERYIPLLTGAAKRLEAAGADFLVMPCNSLHVFIQQLRDAVSIPVLSIVEETAKFLESKDVKRVGILATDITISNGLYEKELQKKNIEQVVPDGLNRAKIGKLIGNIVFNRHDNRDRETLQKVAEDFAQQGLQQVILACTDLQLLIPKHGQLDIYDTMKIFADATVERLIE